jgi:hypothetical protein
MVNKGITKPKKAAHGWKAVRASFTKWRAGRIMGWH